MLLRGNEQHHMNKMPKNAAATRFYTGGTSKPSAAKSLISGRGGVLLATISVGAVSPKQPPAIPQPSSLLPRRLVNDRAISREKRATDACPRGARIIFIEPLKAKNKLYTSLVAARVLKNTQRVRKGVFKPEFVLHDCPITARREPHAGGVC